MNKKTKVGLGIIISILVLILLIFNTVRENKIVNNFEKYLNSHKTEFSQYMIGKEEKEYKALNKRAKKAIEQKNVTIIPKLEEEMNQLVVTAQKDNEQILTKELNDLEHFNLDKVPNTKKVEIKNSMKKINTLIDEKKYNDASKEIKAVKDQIYSLINN